MMTSKKRHLTDEQIEKTMTNSEYSLSSITILVIFLHLYYKHRTQSNLKENASFIDLIKLDVVHIAFLR